MDLELCFFRHGRTYWNAEGRYQGLADTQLDELGWRQAKAVANRTKQMEPIGLYSSDLERCANVGKLISDATGLELKLDERLRERDLGTWSGKVREEVRQVDPKGLEAWMAGDENVRPGGGESITDVLARVESFVSSITRDHSSGVVVAVSHGAFIRHVVHWVGGPQFPRNAIGVPSQASLTVIRIRDRGSSVEAYNDRGHLLSVEAIDAEGPAPAVY